MCDRILDHRPVRDRSVLTLVGLVLSGAVPLNRILHASRSSCPAQTVQERLGGTSRRSPRRASKASCVVRPWRQAAEVARMRVCRDQLRISACRVGRAAGAVRADPRPRCRTSPSSPARRRLLASLTGEVSPAISAALSLFTLLRVHDARRRLPARGDRGPSMPRPHRRCAPRTSRRAVPRLSRGNCRARGSTSRATGSRVA